MGFSDRMWLEFQCNDDRKWKERLLCERGRLEAQNVTQIQLSGCSDFSVAQLHELISQISQARKLRGLYRIFLNESLFRDCLDLFHELFLHFDSGTTSPPVCLSNSYWPSLASVTSPWKLSLTSFSTKLGAPGVCFHNILCFPYHWSYYILL